MSLEELSWYIDNTIAKRLLSVPGVAAVSRTGGVDRTIRVILDPAALQAQGITAAQVNGQLRQSNMNAAGGRAEIAGSEQSVRVLGNARNAYDLSQTQISLPGGRFVKLADLGEVKDSYSEQRTLAKRMASRSSASRSNAPKAPRKSPPTTRRGKSSTRSRRKTPRSTSRRSSTRSTTPRGSTRRRWRAWSKARSSPSSSSFCSFATSARPSFPRLRSRCRRSPPSSS